MKETLRTDRGVISRQTCRLTFRHCTLIIGTVAFWAGFQSSAGLVGSRVPQNNLAGFLDEIQISATVCGYFHNLALLATGKTIFWGVNDYGKAMSPPPAATSSPWTSAAPRPTSPPTPKANASFAPAVVPLRKTNSAGGIITVKLAKDNFAPTWTDDGLTNETIADKPVTLPVTEIANGQVFTGAKLLLDKATQDKSGSAKSMATAHDFS